MNKHVGCDKPVEVLGGGGAELCTSSQRNGRATEEEAMELKGGENFPKEAPNSTEKTAERKKVNIVLWMQ